MYMCSLRSERLNKGPNSLTFSPHFSMACRKTLVFNRDFISFTKSSFSSLLRTINLLVVPVVNGFDVAKNDLVLALSEIVGYGRRQTARIADVGRMPSVDTETHHGHVTIDNLAKITDVVSLCFHQFLFQRTQSKGFSTSKK